MTAPVPARSAWPWAALGLAGSVLAASAAPRAVPDPTVRWWYGPAFPAGHALSLALVYVGMAALCCAWLGLGRSLPARPALLAIGVAWALPLALAPPLFSRDVYSYLAQGMVLHLGHSPYHSAPEVLGRLGQQRILDAVSPFWRHTTAPYGPLFLGLVSVVVGIVGAHLVVGVLLIRLIEVSGLALLAIFVPRLARALGTDAERALWLALLSPLVMLELITAGHNDVMMAGILAAGVACALSGRPLLGVAVCALGATIKVPALAGALFIAVAWGRVEIGRRAQLRFFALAALSAAAVLALVSVVTASGVGWLSTSLFSTPAKVRLAVTPATAVGYTIASLLRDVGVTTSGRGLEGDLGIVASVLTAGTGLILLYRMTIPRLVAYLGAFLLIAAAGGPAAWPWYFIWGLVLVAAVPGVQRSAVLPPVIALAVFIVRPDGILALPRSAAPAVLLVYMAIVVAAGLVHRRRQPDADRAPPADRGNPPAPPTIRAGAPSALAGR